MLCMTDDRNRNTYQLTGSIVILSESTHAYTHTSSLYYSTEYIYMHALAIALGA